MKTISQVIAEELQVTEAQVSAAVTLLDEGATVPFIARYRKEATNGLTDTHLRHLEERLLYLRELEERRQVILKTIEEQGKLSEELKAEIVKADTKTRLEDLYLPYKPKRRSKAQIAREAGLAPLAEALYQNPELDPEAEAAKYLNSEKDIHDTKAALDGAKQILMEQFSEAADLLEQLRSELWNFGVVHSSVVEGKEEEAAKFRDYFDYHETINTIPSHRALAIFRGRKSGFLHISLTHKEANADNDPCQALIARFAQVADRGRPADTWLQEVLRWTWKVKLHNQMETELLTRLREAGEEEAIKVFAKNLHDLLMVAPAGGRVTLGLDPGLRTGVKVVVVSATGELLAHGAIFPHAPKNQWQESIATLAALCKQHQVELISIGNGTASRETDKLAAELIKQHPELNLKKIVVSEAGASVYSASEYAAEEFPALDVSYRGAVSIARRLQDPLAELVKIDAKSIGVGQYQHDVNQLRLARTLDAVVEDCVNAVGVDVNTASVPLMRRVAGLNQTIASNIVAYRSKNGAFKSREQLKLVPRFGEKTFEQSAGFLRIRHSEHPLDASAVHPESYSVVEKIAARCDKALGSLIANTDVLKTIKAEDFVTQDVGLHTLRDILRELEKPGRDPRPEFKAPAFKEGIAELKDLKEGLILEGVVTNVTNFGAFVDIGVHQDGLVHISALAHKFIKDPRELVKAGDLVKVKVLDVDMARNRISLTMRLNEEADKAGEKNSSRLISKEEARNVAHTKAKSTGRGNSAAGNKKSAGEAEKLGTFADLFAKARTLKKK